MRLLASALFALAALASALAGVGLVIVAHDEPPGSGPVHEHAATVYRFPLLLLAGAPGVPRAEELEHHVRARHLDHLRGLLGIPGASVGPVHPLAELAAGTILALLVVLIPRLPRPTRRAIAEMPLPRLTQPQWCASSPIPPPRASVLAPSR